MPDLQTEKSKKAVVLLFILGIFAIALTILPYIATFGLASDFSLSRSDGAWSNFGSYVGGVLGPTFALFAFMAVLVSIWLQVKQLEHTKRQSHLEELQRVIAVVSKTIDDLLLQPAGPSSNPLIATHGERTVLVVLAAAGSTALKMGTTTDYMVVAKNNTVIQSAKDALILQARSLSTELDQIFWCLQEYEKEGGSLTVTDFYKRRYSTIFCWLDSLELARFSNKIQDYFKPKDET